MAFVKNKLRNKPNQKKGNRKRKKKKKKGRGKEKVEEKEIIPSKTRKKKKERTVCLFEWTGLAFFFLVSRRNINNNALND